MGLMGIGLLNSILCSRRGIWWGWRGIGRGRGVWGVRGREVISRVGRRHSEARSDRNNVVAYEVQVIVDEEEINGEFEYGDDADNVEEAREDQG